MTPCTLDLATYLGSKIRLCLVVTWADGPDKDESHTPTHKQTDISFHFMDHASHGSVFFLRLLAILNSPYKMVESNLVDHDRGARKLSDLAHGCKT
jgi:hypothetical protein